jgi:MFS family permease
VIIALLTGLNFLNYLDRMLVAAVLLRIKEPVALGGLGLSNLEAGLLATVFLLGYFVTAPIFGAMADKGPRKKLIAFGVLTWSLATLASGLAPTLGWMLLARAVVGIGEASYATLAPTIIDDLTPPEKKGKMLAIFYAAMPIGAAAGFMLGGYIQARWGWRTAFFVGGFPGILAALLCLAIVEPHRKLRAAGTRITDAVRALIKIAQYRRAVLGYCAHTAMIGAFSHWGPTYLAGRYMLGPTQEKSLEIASFWFGLVTVAAGFIGTVLGGWLGDRSSVRCPVLIDASHDDVTNRRAVNGLLKICAIGALVATPLTAMALLSPNAAGFFILCFFAELGLFIGTSPINAALLRGVPPELRASSMAIAIFAIHLFGDLWSPSLLGLLADHLPMLVAMMSLPVAVGLAAYVWWPRKREASTSSAQAC